MHKYLARCGVASRRAAEELIAEGRVSVNGDVIQIMGRKLDVGDAVSVDGLPVHAPSIIYILMNKPVGYVTTLHDPQGRQTVMRLLPDVGAVIKPVGRLDKETEGLLLFTNDGELAARLTHPRYGIEKEYIASVLGAPAEATIERLRRGVVIEGRRTAPAKVELIRSDSGGRSQIKLILHEGRKRQVRLMCLTVGHPVTKLRRVRIGAIRDKGLPLGQCRPLTKGEVDGLKRAVGLLA